MEVKDTTPLFGARRDWQLCDIHWPIIAIAATEALREGQTLWTTIDAPWLKDTSESWLAGTINELRRMAPKAILSSHLPPAFGMEERFLEALAAARSAPAFAGPDQAAFEAMLAGRDAA